ncbi:hypothetical protein QZH41_009116 [Actinostola sp. cb2023]|nr:hypothetical protein QZH41_009116 [Actinostola sp. cb2023]
MSTLLACTLGQISAASSLLAILTSLQKTLQPSTSTLACLNVPSFPHIASIVPNRCNGKLTFPLCRTCANNQQEPCDHSDNEHAISGIQKTPSK